MNYAITFLYVIVKRKDKRNFADMKNSSKCVPILVLCFTDDSATTYKVYKLSHCIQCILCILVAPDLDYKQTWVFIKGHRPAKQPSTPA